MGMSEQNVVQLIAGDFWMMRVLSNVQSLGLPDWCVCAGFVRSKVWDHFHGFVHRTPLPDVDVVYFDADHTDEQIEKEYEKILHGLDASIPWSVKNQARMHSKNGNEPYVSTSDGLAHFPEVCTAIGAYLNANGEVRLVAPYGIDDLVHMVVRPTPFYTSKEKLRIYEQRVDTKKWNRIWDQLHIVRP
jgi:hypothetical protein